MTEQLSPEPELIGKAREIKLMITDVDGVWTDGGISFDADLIESKTFNVKDGLAVKLIREFGIKTAVLTGRNARAVQTRCQELGIDYYYHSIENKLSAFLELLEQVGISAEECAFIGDDLPDLPVLTKVGFSAAPSDAMYYVKERVDYVTSKKGGDGAFREFCDLILEAKGHLPAILSSYSKQTYEKE